MAQTTVTFRMDEALKKDFDELCGQLGMSMSTAFIIYAKQMIRHGGVPFEIVADPFFSESNLRSVKNGIDQLKAGQTVTKSIDELEKLADE